VGLLKNAHLFVGSILQIESTSVCHSRAGGNPVFFISWIPAFAGMTKYWIARSVPGNDTIFVHLRH
jgi:hypothetical protein